MEHEEEIVLLVVLVDQFNEPSPAIEADRQPLSCGSLTIGNHPTHRDGDVFRRDLRVPTCDPRMNPYFAQGGLLSKV